MAELTFTESDGPIRLSLSDHEAVIRGNGRIQYASRSLRHSVASERFHRSSLLRWADRATKFATVISLVGMAALWAWRWWEGTDGPPFLSVASNILSVAFLGSLFSYGGVNILSLQAQAQVQEDRALARDSRTACPFEPLALERDEQVHGPGNPDFCLKCPLGIDTVDDRDRGFLIHNCSVYADLHASWRQAQ